MKQSDARKLIVKVITGQLEYNGITLGNTELNAIADDVLSALIGLGMEPPEVITTDQLTIGKILIGSLRKSRDWEPEDEN